MKYNNTVSGAIIGIMTIIIISLILFIVDLDFGVLNVISLIAIDSFIIWVYFKFIKFQKDEFKLNFLLKRENILIIFGLIIIIIAVSTPFIIIWSNNYKYSLEFFEDLGPVGDFFGGTTVGLLSLASLMFVTAAMFMQKEELELQRKEITATRKEYEITNITMKKQSFDSTYFNMINLHQSILSQVKLKNNDDRGRVVFEELYKAFKKSSMKAQSALWNSILFDEYFPPEIRKKYLYDTCVHSDPYELKKQFHNLIVESKKRFTRVDINDDLHNLYEILDKMLIYPEDYLAIISEEKNKQLFIFLANNNLLHEKVDLNLVKKNVLKNLSNEHKKEIYESFYNTHENVIGHYYRNLYRIVKYIQEYDFSSNNNLNQREEINYNEKKEYKGILRAQLSSYELLMIFYNVCYSEKGEKFKILLHSTDFFDNHLVEEDFIWENDVEQLKYFKS